MSIGKIIKNNKIDSIIAHEIKFPGKLIIQIFKHQSQMIARKQVTIFMILSKIEIALKMKAQRLK